MDQTWAVALGAIISIVSAALGAVGGYAGGKAQARGTVEGVELQLAGQRADALWQMEVDACTLYIDRCNQALFKIGQVVSIGQLEASQAETLAVYGIESRDEIIRSLRGLQDECMLQEVALGLRLPSALAEGAKGVRESLTSTTDALYRWCAARAGRTPDEAERWQDLIDRTTAFRRGVGRFTSDAQARFTAPHPARSGGPQRRSLTWTRR
ncbi:hypothetical protein [Streptomyces sp. NBC_00568]|uniref:hypothetical protein n=1 Tax=Streptomyces sp. NBC_00568 TaxID=2975779 RepID=UPI0022545DF8|nr:hypothetical protein [Streptomyces sp. NBC_00568]MCX4988436.1 hypothetical protein [Streptomyces sp. NBC_00568]